MSNPIAIACSDIHLSHSPPVARSAEPDWYKAMERPLDELRKLCDVYRAPLLICGDIFDRWNPPPELINFALDQFMFSYGVYSIPGQHDLPNHSFDEIKRSAYYTLIASKRIVDISGDYGVLMSPESRGYLYPFEWGREVEPRDKDRERDCITIAMVHSYIWRSGFGFSGADSNKELTQWEKKLKGYDVALFGDNHLGFHSQLNHGQFVFNCGGFMRRRSDEIGYAPRVGIVFDDGTVGPHYLDISEDKFIDVGVAREAEKVTRDTSKFFNELRGVEGDSLDFRHVMDRYLDFHEIDPEVAKLVLESMEDVN